MLLFRAFHKLCRDSALRFHDIHRQVFNFFNQELEHWVQAARKVR
jgi:hypothetical protein